MSETSTLIGYGGRTIGREELALVPTPVATETHRPVPHHEIVRALIETLGFRHIGVVHDEYAVSPDGMKAFGVLDLETEMAGCRFSIGLRNSHDKSMRLAMTCGYRVFVCSNMAFAGDFTPVLAKHSKSFSLIDCISVGVDRMQRNFEFMRKQVETWQRSELTDVTAKGLRRPNDWPRRTRTGAHTSGNGNPPPGPAPRDRASPDRDAWFSPHRSRPR